MALNSLICADVPLRNCSPTNDDFAHDATIVSDYFGAEAGVGPGQEMAMNATI